MQNNQVNAYTGTGPLLTDNNPISEYFLLKGTGSWSSPRLWFEKPASELALVVGGLLLLLVVVVAVDARFGRRRVARTHDPNRASMAAQVT
jgi:hypothetical protein